MQQIKLWEVQDDSIRRISKGHLDYENRLEKWLIEDISILSSNLVVIGSQVPTPFGKIIDILVLNSLGEVIIVELKRDKTYREVIAQVLDYATWVKELSYDDLNNILNKYGNSESRELGDLFSSKFNIDAEDIEFNSDHKMLIVGSEIDDSTVRIVNYLSNEPYSVNINAVNFNYFKDHTGREFLAQSFVVPEENLLEVSKSKSRNRKESAFFRLFNSQRLKVGDKVYLNPALERGVNKNDPRVSATVVNLGTKCLQRSNESETYSFSKLRKVIAEELNLDGNFGWGFNIASDWINEDGITLAQLLED